MANERTERLVKEVKILLPPSFIINTGDEKIAAFIDMVIGDVNWWPPYTGYNIDNLPPQYEVIVKFGTQVFATLFLQATYALQDFDWSDAGLSLRLDRVQKLDVSYKNILEMYKTMCTNAKKYEIVAMGGKGLNTPRYQSQLGQFLKVSLGCLQLHTNILTNLGSKAIYLIKPQEDFVFGLNKKFNKVLATLKKYTEENLYYVKVGKKEIQLTGNHEIFIKGKGWVEAEKINKDDKCFVGEGLEPISISKISKLPFKGFVYDLAVENVHNYNANGIIVHNSAFTWNSPQ